MAFFFVRRGIFLTAVLAFSFLPAMAAKKKDKEVAKPPAPTITISLDATETPRKIFHAKLAIPAKPGRDWVGGPRSDSMPWFGKWLRRT